jgi:peptide/nickel transport system permease protein
MNKTFLNLIFKRGIYSLMILFLLITFIFILLRLAPGDPAGKYISPGLSPALSENVRESFGLNESILIQYKNFLISTLTGDLGISFNYRAPVTEVIGDFLPFTFFFSLVSFSIQMIFAVFLSLAAAKRRGTRSDKFISETNLVVYAIPSFLTGVLLIFVFSELLGLFPSSGLHSYNFSSMSLPEKFSDLFRHLFLPLVTLTLGGMTVLYRYLRENMDEVFNSDFVLYLRSNGVPRREIIRGHVLPNALGPMISVAGIELGILFSGALITEVIFGLPGMGRLTVQAILARDYPLVTGAVLVSGTLIIFSNFAADIIRGKIDKRLISRGVIS